MLFTSISALVTIVSALVIKSLETPSTRLPSVLSISISSIITDFLKNALYQGLSILPRSYTSPIPGTISL